MGCATSKPAVKDAVTPKIEIIKSPKMKAFDNIPKDSSNTCTLLGSDQKVIVRNTWTLMMGDTPVENTELLGKKVFLRIFEKMPAIKQMFPFRSVWGDELLNHPHFQTHASRFMQVIAAAVDNLDYLEGTYADSVYTLGKSHAYQKGFSDSYFDTVIACIFYIWKQELRGDFSDETEKSWKMVFDFILGKLKEGYDYEVGVLNTMATTTTQQQNGNVGNGTAVGS